jgi:hypothetical protein
MTEPHSHDGSVQACCPAHPRGPAIACSRAAANAPLAIARDHWRHDPFQRVLSQVKAAAKHKGLPVSALSDQSCVGRDPSLARLVKELDATGDGYISVADVIASLQRNSRERHLIKWCASRRSCRTGTRPHPCARLTTPAPTIAGSPS